MKIAKIAVPLPLYDTFDYLIDDNNSDIRIGSLVNILFSKIKTIGVVIELEDIIDSKYKLKNIESIVNIKPFSKNLVEFIKWVADYNIIPIGMVFKFVFNDKYITNTDKYVNTYCFNFNNKINKITDKQKNVVNFLQLDKKTHTFEELKQFCSLNILKTLVKNNVIIEQKEKYKQYDYSIHNITLNTLSTEQNDVLNKIFLFIKENNKPVLLEGTTGSGKTEIYFHLFAKYLNEDNNNQVLFLLPEIALTSQFIDRIKSQFHSQDIAVWHSNISDNNKKIIWNNLLNGTIRIVIGARSALFLPFNKLSIIVVDEEHDQSYKQVDNGNYNARDMAVVRGKIENCPVILGSATPSLESLINVDNNKYNYVYLKNRFGNSTLPLIEIIDLTKEKLKSNSYLSKKLITEMQYELDKKNQILLFMNRRGYAPIAICKECGYRFICSNCSVALTVHKKEGLFICHKCNHKIKETTNCPSCGSENSIIFFGPGVEKIENEVKNYFPDKKTALITSDTIQNITEIRSIISKIINGEIDIIIGTQMITKGYDFPKLTMVGVLDADASLFGANFRASERTYQLLTQVIGRTGRRNIQGKAFIQSYSSDNMIIQALKNNDKNLIINFEKENRQLMELPPYGKLIMLSISGKDEIKVYRKIKEIACMFPYSDKITIYGPNQMNIYKVNNDFRFKILISTPNNINVQKLILNVINKVKIDNSLKLKIDVNPYFIG